jgi:stage II sporulation protein R
MRKRFLTGLLLLVLGTVGVVKTAAPALKTISSHDDILRLHVIAASDSEEDQSAKLQVRDAILPLFSAAESYEDARAFLLSHGSEIQSAAEAVLKDRGLDYGVQLSLGTETFPDRVYGETLFPAGEYDALCVRLGRAEGHNWWCVLFPPLCIVSETGEPVDLDEAEPVSLILDWIRSLF